MLGDYVPSALIPASDFVNKIKRKTSLAEITSNGEMVDSGFSDDGETTELQIAINNVSDAENMGFKILEAMQQKKMSLSQWMPVLSGSQNVTDNDTFPEIYTIALSRSDDWALDQEGFESFGGHKADMGALAEAMGEAHEAKQFDRAANERNAYPSLLTTSVKEVRANFLQLHTERFGTLSPEERNAARVGEVPVGVNGSELLDEGVFMSLQVATQKKNAKQLKWVTRAISKLEAEVCTRTIHGKPAARVRRSRSYRGYWSGWWPQVTCDGWEDIAGICYERCASNEVGHWFACHQTCNGWEDTGSTCNKRCNIPSLSHISTTCGLAYCAKSTGDCVNKVAKLAILFINALSNFVPGAAAMQALKTAARTMSKAAIKTAIKRAVKEVARGLLNTAKTKLRTYMKKQGRELRTAILESVLQGGVEAAAESMVAMDEEGGDLAQAALELVEAVDPTGVASIVNEFQEDSCSSKEIEDMPEEDLVEEVCRDSVTLSGTQSHQRQRMGTFEYTGEDNHQRPIYLHNDNHNQFLYYSLNVGWLVGADSTSNFAGVHARGDDFCPPSSGYKFWNGNAWASSPSVSAA